MQIVWELKLNAEFAEVFFLLVQQANRFVGLVFVPGNWVHSDYRNVLCDFSFAMKA